MYEYGGHVGNVTMAVWTFFDSHNPWRLYMKFGSNWPRCLTGEELEYIDCRITNNGPNPTL